MYRARKVAITDINQHLTCKLCKGYFIDATTIIECLHSFCRSCIVKYLETNKYCPVCDVQVHKTKPLLNIRPDRILQDIVYKLVPKLFQNEVQRRRDFCLPHPETKANFEQFADNFQHLITSDESISLTLSFQECKESMRYLRCPAAVSVIHLQKLIRAKYDLTDSYRVDIFYDRDCLDPSLTLIDIAYIYSWKRKGPIELTYRIYEHVKRIKLEEKVEPVRNANNNNWKEVQLRISENGEMSVTGIQDDTVKIVNNNNYEPQLLTIIDGDNSKVSQKELPELKAINNTTTAISVSNILTNASETVNISASDLTSCVSLSSATTKTVFSTINASKCSVSASDNKVYSERKKIEDEKKIETPVPVTIKNPDDVIKSTTITTTTTSTGDKGVKRKADPVQNASDEQPAKQQKPTVLNHSLGLQNLSNNHPLKKHSHLNKTNEITVDKKESSNNNDSLTPKPPNSSIVNKVITNTITVNNRPSTPVVTMTTTTMATATTTTITTPKPVSKPCYMPKTVINVPKPSTSTVPKNDVVNKVQQQTTSCSNVTKNETKPITSPAIINQTPNKLNIKTKPSTPIGYKTLRDPPKSWNSQIAKAKPIPDPKYNDLKNVRPAKFFKMRNNLPRYLGNPASGVKPMYQVHVSPEKDKDKTPEAPPKGEIKKHSIVKIDPKTLKPISEKAPETTSLSNSSSTSSTSDLKINTSSVSIFNPLKLQNSPKNERKSPKSPHSPKTKSASSPTAMKRDKLNLNFTPPNPFIPNLTSPTISPNQFLYPPGPPGFPPYDPRMVAAYHSLFYGPFSSGLNLDTNQRKNFDLTGPTSPKVGSVSQAHSPQQPSMKIPITSEQLSLQNLSRLSKSSTYKSPSALKKSSKESTNKNEKSLQNAVERLTQNRVKEIKNEAATTSSSNSTTNTTTTTTTVTTTSTTTATTTITTTKPQITDEKKCSKDTKEESSKREKNIQSNNNDNQKVEKEKITDKKDETTTKKDKTDSPTSETRKDEKSVSSETNELKK